MPNHLRLRAKSMALMAPVLLAASISSLAEDVRLPDGPVSLLCTGYIELSWVNSSGRLQEARSKLAERFQVNAEKTAIIWLDQKDGDNLDRFQKSDTAYVFHTFISRGEIGDRWHAVDLRWSINRLTLSARVDEMKSDLDPSLPVFHPKNRDRPSVVDRSYDFHCQSIRLESPI